MNPEPQTWRFIDSGAHDGAFNMATDEVLAHRLPPNRPILRVYRWQPFTISLGYHQKRAEVDVARCVRDGIGLVRRPTGGRAILHAQEVTYSVIVPESHPLFQSGTLESYNRISAALVAGLRKLGLPAELARNQRGGPDAREYAHRFACFAASAKYEIMFRGKKLVGSAQRRFRDALLQHGSILLGPQHLRLVEYLTGSRNGGRERALDLLKSKTICVGDILAREVHYTEVVADLREGFENEFGVRLEHEPLTQQEIDLIKEVRRQYRTI
ncbi:MAG: lipoate--protein ligase family protein [Calditrichaeota bacterium]|nr:MAG: lipoate--protein ligase family protein [Calditrichota bacterium]